MTSNELGGVKRLSDGAARSKCSRFPIWESGIFSAATSPLLQTSTQADNECVGAAESRPGEDGVLAAGSSSLVSKATLKDVIPVIISLAAGTGSRIGGRFKGELHRHNSIEQRPNKSLQYDRR